MKHITPFLWFDKEAEDAAKLYTSVIPNSKITGVTHYGEAGPREPGMIMTVDFELNGQKFVALNGGPDFKFNEAVSFVLNCETQDEVDELWEKLSDGGEQGPCGWLKDRYGLSWQVVPTVLPELLQDKNSEKSKRVMAAVLKMKKLDIHALEDAYEHA